MRYLLTIISLSICMQMQSQSLTDAIRYSQQQIAGTARTAGVAGSFGAMGGDIGSMHINPAGLGDFYKSEFNFGLSLNRVNSEAFLSMDPSNISSVDDLNFNVNHLGMVFSGRPGGDLITSNFILGVGQTNNYTQEISYGGKSIGSITERFAEVANGVNLDDLDPFEAGVAYDAGAIYDIHDDLVYETDFFDTTSFVQKNQYIDRTGKMYDLTLGWAGNYDNVLNFGFVASMPLVSFEEYKRYIEEDEDDELPVFTKLDYLENLSTSGYGFNFKAGVTGKFAKIFRVGAAYHSPTWFTITDDYSTELTYSWDEGEPRTESAQSGDGRFKYKFLTPGKVILSGGVLLNAGDLKGFINADYEIKNYTNADFDFNAFSQGGNFIEFENEVNSEIKGELARSQSFKLGAELAYKKIRLRAGVAGEGSPYKIDNGGFIRQTVTGGIGLREENFYIDFTAYSHSDSEGMYPYLVLTNGRNQLVNVDKTTFKGIMTVGFMF